MTRMLNVVQQQRIASLASVNLVMREMVLPVKVSMIILHALYWCVHGPQNKWV